jgi:hypothetical protein
LDGVADGRSAGGEIPPVLFRRGRPARFTIARDVGIEVNQSRDSAACAVGRGGDNHSCVTMTDKCGVSGVSSVEKSQYIVGVSVKVGGRDSHPIIVRSEAS